MALSKMKNERDRSSTSEESFHMLTPPSSSSPQEDIGDLESQHDDPLDESLAPLWSEKGARRRRYYGQLHKGILFAVSGLLGVLVIAGFLALSFSLSPSTSSSSSTNHDVSTSDGDKYIVGQNWDFSAPPTTRTYDFTIRDTTYNPDGVYRQMMLINNEFPGPMIELNEDDTLVVNVHNEAMNATSIHWHGIYQNGTNHMDGTVGITQCPIASGGHFSYTFTVRQSGTYWYHAHQGVQASDGLFGPLVIHPRGDVVRDYVSDRIVMVSDHYHDTSSELLMTYLASDRENIEPVPDTALINGHALRNCSSLPSRKCEATPNVYIPQFDLEKGKRHKLRFINAGAFAEFQVSIDEHAFQIVEADGTELHPVEFDRLAINAAQRYSVVVDLNRTSSDAGGDNAYWLRAKMIRTCFGEKNPNLQDEARVAIRYVDSPATTSSDGKGAMTVIPQSKDWDMQTLMTCRDMNTTDLHPINAPPMPAVADASFYLRSNFEIGAYRLSRGFWNSSSFKADVRSPTLHRLVDGLASGNASFTSSGLTESNLFSSNAHGSSFISPAFATNKELTIQTTGIQTLDLLISNFDDGNHPVHLHGYKFFVLAQGHGYPASDLLETIDLSNPLLRDTASVEAFGWVLLRVVADNPGVWALHCHVSWHAEAGLVMQLATRVDALGGVPEGNRELCAASEGELRKGMGPMDEVFMVDEE